MKKIIQIITSIFLLFMSINPLFANQKVEDVFIDIDKNFEYKNQLQYLYDLGFIGVNQTKSFSPNTYISRDEFVGLLLETNCQSCIKPNTDIDILSTYFDSNVYYDVNKNNNYFYCIAYADEKKYIQGYQKNTVCDNGETSNDTPFCPYNSIKLEEALAIIMRTSGILSQSEADEIIQKIYNGEQYPDIGKDIKPKLTNGEIYSFYPYFYVAQNYTITDIDNFGNISELQLIQPDENQYYYPQAPVTKSKMLNLALFSHKNSQCSEPKYKIGGYIDILNGNCRENQSCTINPNYIIKNNFDFTPRFDTEFIIPTQESNFQWVITHKKSGTQQLLSGKYLDNIYLDTAGEYNIDFYVTDISGNKGKFSQNFSLSSQNNNNFQGYIGSQQSGDTFNYTANISGNTGPYTYKWDFGDRNSSDQQNPNHSYTQPGKYTVTLEVTDSNGETHIFYTQSEIKNTKNDGHVGVEIIFIGENNIADFSAEDIIADEYYWDFGDGNSSNQKNPNHSYTQPGTYEVTLITQNQQGEKTYKLSVTIPQSGDDLYSSIDIQNSSNLNSYNFSPLVQGGEGPFEYLWDFGDGNTSSQKNPSHSYNTTGDHTVTLVVTDSNGNTSQSTTQISIQSPKDNFQAIVNQTDNPFTFDFNGIASDGNNPKYTWDFGDGNTSSQKNPNHTYQQPGEYNVGVTIENGNTSETFNFIVIVPQPENNLEATAHISSQNLDNNSYGFNADIISGEGPFEYLWDFGDGNSSNQKNPNHTFEGSGPFQVSVLITDEAGNKVVKNFTLYPDFIPLDTRLEIQENQNTNSYLFDADIISGKGPFEYLWNFGDGNSSNQKKPNHTFEYNGEYFVQLTTTDIYGNSETNFVNIIISDAQKSHFNIQAKADKMSGNIPLKVAFSSEIIGNQNDTYQYTWNFGDGSSGYGKNSQHTYFAQGSYIVTLNVKNQSGETKQKTLTISVLNNQEPFEEENQSEIIDSDNDGVDDANDKCINLPGSAENKGCPIFETFCESDNDCPSNGKCSAGINGTKTCVAVEQQVTCNNPNQGIIQGNVVCNTCPCQNTLNFKAQLRSCDIVFPAIVSPDGKNIYSKGEYFQIK